MNAVVESFNAFNRRLRPVKSGICSHCGKEFFKPNECNPLFHLTDPSISGDSPFGGSLICANCIHELDHECGDLSNILIIGEETKGVYIDTINWVVLDTIN